MTLVLLPYLAVGRRLLLEFTPWKSTDPLLLIAPIVLMLVLAEALRHRAAPPWWGPYLEAHRLPAGADIPRGVQPARRRTEGRCGRPALHGGASPLVLRRAGARDSARPESLFSQRSSVSACLIATYGIAQTWDGLPSWDRMWVKQSRVRRLVRRQRDPRVRNILKRGGVRVIPGNRGSSWQSPSRSTDGRTCSRPYLCSRTRSSTSQAAESSSRPWLPCSSYSPRNQEAWRARRSSLLSASAHSVVGVILTRGALQTASSSSNPLVSHTTGGLLHPLSSSQSTLPAHFSLLENGFKKGVFDPIGFGIGSTTEASRLGNPQAAVTEVDLSNEFLAEGTFGGLAYLSVVLFVLAVALRNAVEQRDAVSLSVLGVLVTLLGQWLNGGYWALSPLVWFIIGFLVAGQRTITPARRNTCTPTSSSVERAAPPTRGSGSHSRFPP